MRPPRGSSDGVKDRHAKMIAPQHPGSVTYSSFRGFFGAAGGGGVSAVATAGAAPPAGTGSPAGVVPPGGAVPPGGGGWPVSPAPAARWSAASGCSPGDQSAGGPAVSRAMTDPVRAGPLASSPSRG